MSTEAGAIASGLDLFGAAGARVVPMEDFDLQACWVEDVRILLVADDLTPEEWGRLIEVYLPLALDAQGRA